MPSNESVFNRLYRQSTAASRAASVNGLDSSSYRSESTSSNRASSYRQSRRQVQTIQTRTYGKDVKSSIDKEHSEDIPTKKSMVVAPPSYSGQWRMSVTSKYDNGSNKTLTSLDPQSLKLSDKLHSFDQGEIDARRFACHLIAAMFDRDHMPGRHWDYDSPSASPLESDEKYILKFKAEKEATWDWKDIYSVATAKGTITFNTRTHEIRIVDYSYYAAG